MPFRRKQYTMVKPWTKIGKIIYLLKRPEGLTCLEAFENYGISHLATSFDVIENLFGFRVMCVGKRKEEPLLKVRNVMRNHNIYRITCAFNYDGTVKEDYALTST